MFEMLASGAATSWVVGRMGTDAHLYDDPEDAAIPALLDSRFDGDKVDALKRLLALIAQGVDVAHLFPQFLLLQIASSLTPRSGRRQQRWRRHSSVPTSPSITGPSSLEGSCSCCSCLSPWLLKRCIHLCRMNLSTSSSLDQMFNCSPIHCIDPKSGEWNVRCW